MRRAAGRIGGLGQMVAVGCLCGAMAQASCLEPYTHPREKSDVFPNHADVGFTNNCTVPVYLRICVKDQYNRWSDYFARAIYLRPGDSWGGLMGFEGLQGFQPTACAATDASCQEQILTCTPTPGRTR